MATSGYAHENERHHSSVPPQPVSETAPATGDSIHRRGTAEVPVWTPHHERLTAEPAQKPVASPEVGSVFIESSGTAEGLYEALRAAGPPLIDYGDYESLLRLAREPGPEQISPLRPEEPTTPLVYVFGPITDSQVAINAQGDVIQNRTDVRPEQFYRTQFQPARRADPVQVVETVRVEVERLGLDLYSQYVIRQAAAVIKVELARPPINEARVRGAVEQILACLARQPGGRPLTARLAALAARLEAVLGAVGNAAQQNSGSGGVR
jgi:hypothetical protein